MLLVAAYKMQGKMREILLMLPPNTCWEVLDIDPTGNKKRTHDQELFVEVWWKMMFITRSGLYRIVCVPKRECLEEGKSTKG
jgi:hypothetical protein